jgi:hypothetical protein
MIARHFLLLSGVFNDCRAFLFVVRAFLMIVGRFYLLLGIFNCGWAFLNY